MTLRFWSAAGFVLAAALCSAAPALAQCDTTGPSLDDLSLSAAAVDTTLTDQVVTCSMTLSDAPAGVGEAACLFISPVYLQSRTCVAQTPASGTAQNGVFECSVTLPRHAEAGTWTVSVDTADTVSNRNTFISLDLILAGLPATLDVTSDQDVAPPDLTAFSLTPAAVDVSASGQPVTCTAGVADPEAGVETMECSLTGPGQVQAWNCTSNAPSAGTRQSGTFACDVMLPQHAEAGTWEATVALLDQAGNGIALSPAEIQAAGFAKDLVVTSATPDVTPPGQAGFSLTPTMADSAAGPTPVTCTVTVTDDITGVSGVGCILQWIDPGLIAYQFQTCTSESPASGTPLNGVFSCDVMLPRHSAAGQWLATTVLVDEAGNSAQFQPPDVLDVQCGGGVPEVSSQWLGPELLSWDPMAGAASYNVYRRMADALQDADQDGLPDGGYGDCRNASDPDTSDTFFTDAEQPPLAGQVFMYLVSYSGGSGEIGLGGTSGGTDRVVTACP